MSLETPNQTVRQGWAQAVRDMEALRLEDPTFGRGVYIPAAGVPWFVTAFGRDALIVSMQGITGYPEFAASALRQLAQHQATSDDPERVGDRQADRADAGVPGAFAVPAHGG